MLSTITAFTLFSTATAILQPRADTCSVFTQVGATYNVTGDLVPWLGSDFQPFNCTLNKKINPKNESCLIGAAGVVFINSTISTSLNISDPSSLLPIIGNATNTFFNTSVEGIIGTNNTTFLAFGDFGYLAYRPILSCVNGTLSNCTGALDNETTVTACRPIDTGLINGSIHLFNLVADIEVEVTTLPAGCTPGNESFACSTIIIGSLSNAGGRIRGVLIGWGGIMGIVALGMLML